jgi:hypothetical protein
MKFVQLEDRPGIGRPPANRVTLAVPRENAFTVGAKQTTRTKISPNPHETILIGGFGRQPRYVRATKRRTHGIVHSELHLAEGLPEGEIQQMMDLNRTQPLSLRLGK